MKRKNFIKKAVLGTAGLVTAGRISANSPSTYDKLLDQVGFNHIPNTEIKQMKSVLHKANTRGRANLGWLDSSHTFSFANYRNPERMNFGVLRVLNDDVVAPSKGFNTHPHDNMEIISIPLYGDLEHKDSMGNTAVIKQGDVQIMSAGTGIYHSEFNKNADKEVKFLQIWMFPNQKNVDPRYDQITLDNKVTNCIQQVLSPSQDDAGVWAHQNAWFSIGQFDVGYTESYNIKSQGNGLYVFVFEGDVQIGDQQLNERDGYGVWDVDELQIKALSSTRFLLMDVPMHLG